MAARSCSAFCCSIRNVEIVFVTANEQAGKPIGEVHRNLNGLTNLSFIKDSAKISDDIDCVFLALPHGQAMDIVPRLPAGRESDRSSGDFRLRDQSVFEKHYKQPHTAMHAQSEFVYGLTETNREAIKRRALDRESRLFRDCDIAGPRAARRERIAQWPRHC